MENKNEPSLNFIPLDREPGKDGADLFSELSGGLDFGGEKDRTKPAADARHPLEWANDFARIVFSIVLVWSIVYSAFTVLRGYDVLWLKMEPFCSIRSYGIESENPGCLIPSEQKEELSKKKTALEQEMLTKLMTFVPKKLQSHNIFNSPEVQFIQERSGKSRYSIKEIMESFDLVRRDSTAYSGEDIECTDTNVNERWAFTIKCTVYGGSQIGGQAGLEGKIDTSRIAAIKFLERLANKKSGFQVLEYPKTLDSSPFISNEAGIKSAFSTLTEIELKLQYTGAIPSQE